MPKIERLEELVIWQMARRLTKEVYDLTREDEFAKDFGLRNQICRASVSVMSNIAEGFGRKGNKEFLRFLHIAQGSLFEVRSQLYISHDVSYLALPQLERHLQSTEELIKAIKRLMSYLRANPR